MKNDLVMFVCDSYCVAEIVDAESIFAAGYIVNQGGLIVWSNNFTLLEPK